MGLFDALRLQHRINRAVHRRLTYLEYRMALTDAALADFDAATNEVAAELEELRDAVANLDADLATRIGEKAARLRELAPTRRTRCQRSSRPPTPDRSPDQAGAAVFRGGPGSHSTAQEAVSQALEAVMTVPSDSRCPRATPEPAPTTAPHSRYCRRRPGGRRRRRRRRGRRRLEVRRRDRAPTTREGAVRGEEPARAHQGDRTAGPGGREAPPGRDDGIAKLAEQKAELEVQLPELRTANVRRKAAEAAGLPSNGCLG